jgi:hypothetical protein
MSATTAPLPFVVKQHPEERVLQTYAAYLERGSPSLGDRLTLGDVVAELFHLRGQLRLAQDLATQERDRRMVAEQTRDAAVAETARVRRAWSAAAGNAYPDSTVLPYPDATG